MANNFTDQDFEDKVTKAKGLVLVDFWAEWCGPCRMLAPIMEEVAANMEGKVTVGKLNIDENQQTAMKFQVMSIPTVVLFKNGEPVETWIGVRGKQDFLDGIQKHLGAED
jgi:thioredoxin 1